MMLNVYRKQQNFSTTLNTKPKNKQMIQRHKQKNKGNLHEEESGRVRTAHANKNGAINIQLSLNLFTPASVRASSAKTEEKSHAGMHIQKVLPRYVHAHYDLSRCCAYTHRCTFVLLDYLRLHTYKNKKAAAA
jgi:hypothetical protein